MEDFILTISEGGTNDNLSEELLQGINPHMTRIMFLSKLVAEMEITKIKVMRLMLNEYESQSEGNTNKGCSCK